MKAILVRIGVDHSYGAWNAPADAEAGNFVYVPIPEKKGTRFHPRCERPFKEVVPALEQFAAQAELELVKELRCPPALLKASMHLDPDFEYLTYGDVGDRRGSEIRTLQEDDLLVFYAGLRPCGPCDHRLLYAIVGLFVIDEVVEAASIPKYRWPENAHTRKRMRGASDIVVRAKPGVSGRLRRFIPIGEYRDRAYRVRHELLKAWGGLSVNEGYIQRSARPPRFLDARRFHGWFLRQNAELLEVNNPSVEPAQVVVVHLRQPHRGNPNEMRSDPFWEFGSFGCTGCHRRNLMNPRRIHELAGVRLAFAQGGPQGFKLVMLTPPVEVVRHADRCELKWTPTHFPFRYDSAPLLVDALGKSDFPSLKRMIRHVNRTTWPARFSSRFRSCRTPLRQDVAADVCSIFDRACAHSPDAGFAKRYELALPHPPNKIDTARRATYRRLLASIKNAGMSRRSRRC